MREEKTSDCKMDFLDVLEALPVLVFALSESLELVFWNRECERLTGWEKGDLLGRIDISKNLYPDSQYGGHLREAFEANGR